MVGFRQDADGTIRDFGAPPINVRKVDASVRFLGAKPTRATALDEHGYRRGEATLKDGTLTLPADGLYTIVEH